VPETAPQAALPHQRDESPPATVTRKTPRPIRRGASGSPAEPGVRSSTVYIVTAAAGAVPSLLIRIV
jgi:hypothetical protein